MPYLFKQLSKSRFHDAAFGLFLTSGAQITSKSAILIFWVWLMIFAHEIILHAIDIHYIRCVALYGHFDNQSPLRLNCNIYLPLRHTFSSSKTTNISTTQQPVQQFACWHFSLLARALPSLTFCGCYSNLFSCGECFSSLQIWWCVWDIALSSNLQSRLPRSLATTTTILKHSKKPVAVAVATIWLLASLLNISTHCEPSLYNTPLPPSTHCVPLPPQSIVPSSPPNVPCCRIRLLPIVTWEGGDTLITPGFLATTKENSGNCNPNLLPN